MRVISSGAADAVRVAYALGHAARTDLKRQLDRGSRDAAKVIIDEVNENPASYLPSGYEAEFIASMHSRAEVRLLQRRTIVAVFWAEGRQYRRKVEDLDAGILRHPVRGRRRRVKRHWEFKAHYIANPWVDQPIRPGLYTDPGRRALPPAVQKLDDAVARVVQNIERG